MNECLREILQWITMYNLKMNNSKTEIILYGTKQQLAKVKIPSVNVIYHIEIVLIFAMDYFLIFRPIK